MSSKEGRDGEGEETEENGAGTAGVERSTGKPGKGAEEEQTGGPEQEGLRHGDPELDQKKEWRQRRTGNKEGSGWSRNRNAREDSQHTSCLA